MVNNRTKISDSLRKVNFIVAIFLTVFALSTVMVKFEMTWIYMPVFKYFLLDSDKDVHLFIHLYLFYVNLGFYFQLMVIIFSWMVWFAGKRLISFQFLYMVVILRSVLILIQLNIRTTNYFDVYSHNSFVGCHIFYITTFSLLFFLNSWFDDKKRPRIPEPYELKED